MGLGEVEGQCGPGVAAAGWRSRRQAPTSLWIWPLLLHMGRNKQLLETRKLLHCSPVLSSKPSCLFRRKELNVMWTMAHKHL